MATKKEYLLSQNALPINDGVNGSKNVIVKCELYIEQIDFQKNLDINIQYAYFDNTDPAKPALAFKGVSLITEEDQQTLYQAVKADLPNIDDDYASWYQALIMFAARLEMAQTFNILPTDINIVEEAP